MKETPTRDDVMTSSMVHNFTKDILKLSIGLDIVDRVHDVQLALRVLEDELNQALGSFEKDMTVTDEEDNSELCKKYGADCHMCSQTCGPITPRVKTIPIK